ncbi:MAG: phosphoribosylanthranilate isomerase [Cyanobacteria bacterium SZAS LIN-2]|nr:phosphoribosylanthranilate isomerase [Cyanobacteria bacterium SZAS LIN-3]MBS1996639.1 phosphoribosylanthranilate isomerase [Cyanobacteria bacterium SZAS LIN-2]
MFVKICGITNKSDALHAVSAGATHLGLIFVDGSPRCIKDPSLAREIVEATGDAATVVGVFQNQSVDRIAEIAAQTNIGAIQLHGDESPDFCLDVQRKLGKPVIKAITIAGGDMDTHGLSKRVSGYIGAVNYLLFDRAKGDRSENWLAQAISSLQKVEKSEDTALPAYFFAGGLSDQNVAATLQQLQACGADVASGVEKAPGQKDPLLVQNFISAVKGLESRTKEKNCEEQKRS